MGSFPAGLANPIDFTLSPGEIIYQYTKQNLNTSITYNGGAIVTVCNLELLFWGSFWDTASSPSVNDIIGGVQDILNSPYLSGLKSYGFQSISLKGSRIVHSPAPAATFAEPNVAQMVWDLIDNGDFKKPQDENPRTIYMVFAPQNSIFQQVIPGVIVGGQHDDATDTDIIPPEINHAWIAFVNYFGSLDSLMVVFTHELVETITDPEPPSGYYDNATTGQITEIADYCSSYLGWVNGHTVSAYYSNSMLGCIVPSLPFIRKINLIVQTNVISSEEIQTGVTGPAPANSFCFSGSYSWILYNEINTYIFTLDVSTYLFPTITWQINGNDAVAGTIQVPADVSLDPLLSYEFATPPAYNSLIDVAINNNLLTVTTKNLQLPATIQVSCSVSENGLPAEYGTTKQTSLILPVYGWVRKMDNRFQQDLRFCGDKIFKIERSGIKQKVKTIPVPIGDPGEKLKAIHLEGVSKENQAGIREALSRMDELNDKNSSLAKKLHQYVGSLITDGHQ
jgi:hypothetical protein